MSFLTKKILSTITSLIVNEYKFYVDFKGMLYFQDTKEYIYPNAIKDKKFIGQLYQNLIPTQIYFKSKIGQKQQHSANPDKEISSLQNEFKDNKKYPFVAQFWGQRNFLQCGIAPIIFTNLVKGSSIENIQLSEIDKECEYLEFSFGQYSVFDVNQLCIDNDGQLWHPFIKIKSKKQKKETFLEKSNIMGVFSNQFLAQILDHITYQNEEAFLEYKGQHIKIKKKT